MKKFTLLLVTLLLITNLFSTTVKYYDASNYSNYITVTLDNTFVGNNPNIRKWASGSYVSYSGYSGTYDPCGAMPNIASDCLLSGYIITYNMIVECIESALDQVWVNISYDSLVDITIYDNYSEDGDGEIQIDFENDPYYWIPWPTDWAAFAGPSQVGEDEISGGIIRINAIPSFLNTFTWDVSLDHNNTDNDVVYLFRTIMHETFHTLGINHIYGQTAIMNEIGAPGSSFWVYDLTDWDVLAFDKLYNPDACSDVEDNLIGKPLVNSITNYPNPFNPSTTISYNIGNIIQKPIIEIYNMKGQKVRSLKLDETFGENTIIWNGNDNSNNKVSSGVYVYRLVNKGKTIDSRKMILMK